mgnify:CR=1 FL=1
MALSEQTLDYLLEAEGSIRSAIKSAAVNENPLVVTQVSKLLMDIEHIKSFEDLRDLLDSPAKKRDEWLRNSKESIKFIDIRHN